MQWRLFRDYWGLKRLMEAAWWLMGFSGGCMRANGDCMGTIGGMWGLLGTDVG